MYNKNICKYFIVKNRSFSLFHPVQSTNEMSTKWLRLVEKETIDGCSPSFIVVVHFNRYSCRKYVNIIYGTRGEDESLSVTNLLPLSHTSTNMAIYTSILISAIEEKKQREYEEKKQMWELCNYLEKLLCLPSTGRTGF